MPVADDGDENKLHHAGRIQCNSIKPYMACRAA